MKTANIRQVRLDLNTVLNWVAAGEEVAISKRGKTVAILSPPKPPEPPAKPRPRPDFVARAKKIFGKGGLDLKNTKEVLDYSRGNY